MKPLEKIVAIVGLVLPVWALVFNLGYTHGSETEAREAILSKLSTISTDVKEVKEAQTESKVAESAILARVEGLERAVF